MNKKIIIGLGILLILLVGCGPSDYVTCLEETAEDICWEKDCYVIFVVGGDPLKSDYFQVTKEDRLTNHKIYFTQEERDLCRWKDYNDIEEEEQ